MLDLFLTLICQWINTFSQQRTFQRAINLCLGFFTTLGRKTISRNIASRGLAQQDWSADYRLFSRSEWNLCSLFRPIIEGSLKQVNEDYVTVAYDDTLVKKTGKKIKNAGWYRDPLGPPFSTNFVWGIRYLQASILLPLYQTQNTSARAVPVQLTQLPKLIKPPYHASEESYEKYKKLTQYYNTSKIFIRQLRYMRNELDQQQAKEKDLLCVVDGSFCNSTCLTANLSRTTIIGRTRKNARLYFKVRNDENKTKRKRFYNPESFTPEKIRKNTDIAYRKMLAHYGGDWRKISYKEIKDVYWKYVTKRLPLRLIVIAPIPYRRHKKGRLCYRDPSYLLTPDLKLDVKIIIQKYFDRWQIEVNFQEEKRDMGLGQAQVSSDKAIPRVPSFLVATYAALILSGVISCGGKRGDEFEPLPKWRKNSRRPSCLDLITRLRYEINNSPHKLEILGFIPSLEGMVLNSAA